MKKLFKLCLAFTFIFGLVACSKKDSKTPDSNKTLTVSATSNPHAVILEEAKAILEKDYGITLNIEVLSDYYVFNKALADGDVDANYFQHIPFLNNEIANNKYDIVNAGGIHIEPFGFFSKSITSLDELKDGDIIVISNSTSDHGRILTLLASANVITLKDGVDAINATISDIESNPKNLEFVEVKPELLATAYQNNEGVLVAINGNYALEAGLDPTKDAVLVEEASSENPYVNVIACRSEDKDDERIKALVEVLKSDEIRTFIENKYKGSVVVVD